MRLLTPPGVFRPRSDTWMLAQAIREAMRPGARVLDVCTGSGALAIAAAGAGAGSVTAIDVSRRAVLASRVNGALNGVRVRSLRGDLFEPVGHERFDMIVSNPPYLPSAEHELPRHGPRRAWEGGGDGRVILDRLCAQAAEYLRAGGRLMLIHSSLCGTEQTLERLRAAGLRPSILARHTGPLGPLLRERAALLESRGVLARGEREEELVVICAQKPASA